jgi:branched-chain amino acid transport system substrate-binding protein
VVTVGLIVPMTGQSATTGKQEQAGANLYIQLHGDTVAGKKIVLEVEDDAGAPDVTKRLAQDLIANDNAKALMSFGSPRWRSPSRRSRPKRKCLKSSPPRRRR